MLYSFDPPTKEDSGYKAVANVLPSMVAKGTKNPPLEQPWHVLPNDKDGKWLFSNDYFKRWIQVKFKDCESRTLQILPQRLSIY
jgi:hypothetical protein